MTLDNIDDIADQSILNGMGLHDAASRVFKGGHGFGGQLR